MRRSFWLGLAILTIMFLILSGCTQKKDNQLMEPETEMPVIEKGKVVLKWSDVPNALYYDVVIELVTQQNQTRRTRTKWQIETEKSSCEWTILEPGVYNWTVQAFNSKGRSKIVQGKAFTGSPLTEDAFYESPVVNIVKPLDGDFIKTLCPIIKWTAEPGATISEDTSIRGFSIEGCYVRIQKNETIIHANTGVYKADDEWQYDVPLGVLDYNEDYKVEIIASQTNADSVGLDCVSFKTPGELELNLSKTQMYPCGTIIATVTGYNEAIDKVALFGKPVDGGVSDYQKLLPKGNSWRQLDNNNLAVFELDISELSDAGLWTINAQALGGVVNSSEKTIEIKELTLIPNLSLETCCQIIQNGDFLCVEEISEEEPLEATYEVNVHFPVDATSVVDEFRFIFEFAGYEDNIKVSTSSTYNYQTWLAQGAASSISIEMATECTKNATLTVEGTSCSGESSFSTYTTLHFIVDGTPPIVQVKFEELESNEQNPDQGHGHEQTGLESQKTATVTFTATDSKSICQATMSFFVYKVDAHGEQVDVWKEVIVPWGQPTFSIGSEDRIIEAEAVYSGDIGKNASTSIYATVVFHLSELDGATITSSMEVIDCCSVCCKNQCGEIKERKPISGVDQLFFDNVFYRVILENVDFIKEDNELLITDLNNPASMTLFIADAYFSGDALDILTFFGNSPLPPLGVIEGRGSRDNEPGFPEIISTVYISGYSTKTIAECTGFPTKTTIFATTSIQAANHKEGAATFTVAAIDENDNIGFATKTIKVDTLAPSLTVVQGLKKNQGPGKDALQFSFREADADQGVVCLGATVTVITTEAIDSEKRKLDSRVEYPSEFYDNSSGDVILRVNENEGKTWIIDPLYKNGVLDLNGKVRLEVLAQDCYQNKGVSTIEGFIIESAPKR